MSGKTKILYVISLVENSHTFEKTFQFIDKDKFELSVVFLHKQIPLLMKKTQAMGIKAYHIPFYKKKIKDIGVLFQLIKIINIEKPTIVHAHLIDGSFFGMIAAYLCKVKHRFYTRHHSTHHWVYARHAVKYDRLINILSTKIIAVSKLVKDILVSRENVPTNKIVVVHHGFDLAQFEHRDMNRINRLKEKYDLQNGYPVIGNISRFIEEKGITYVIEAFSKLLKSYPNAVLILANAFGVYKNEILTKLRTIPTSNYRIIEFENDIISLYHSFDIFTHVPIDDHTEAFGQIYVESLAAKVPSVFTNSGIAMEFIIDKENAILVPYKNAEAIYNALMLYMNNAELKRKVIENGFKDVRKLFSINNIIKVLEKEYEV